MSDIKLTEIEMETVLRCVDKVFETRAAVEERDRVIAALADRIAALEAEAKQARDDEAWVHLHAVPIHRRGEVWIAEHFDGHRRLDAEGPTIHAALRALRAKVEGGKR